MRDLAAELACHTRTVYRDLEALQAAGFDIQTDTVERGKVYKLGQSNTGVHEIGISATEPSPMSESRARPSSTMANTPSP